MYVYFTAWSTLRRYEWSFRECLSFHSYLAIKFGVNSPKLWFCSWVKHINHVWISVTVWVMFLSLFFQQFPILLKSNILKCFNERKVAKMLHLVHWRLHALQENLLSSLTTTVKAASSLLSLITTRVNSQTVFIHACSNPCFVSVTFQRFT